MEKNHKSKNGTKSSDDKESAKRIPIIETLKPKKRYTKQEKELIEAMKAAMEVITKQQNAKV